MGTVYHAVQEKLGREVALKVLQLGQKNSELDERLVQRFEREVAAACKLRHPNLVPLYDSGRQDTVLYYAMELVGEGRELESFVEGHCAQTPDFVMTLLEQMAAAFEHVHARGLVHRDIKPSNILVTPGPVFRLMDFGLVMDLGRTRLTATGKRIGTPRYMSPEMLVGRPVDGRSDIYQLAIVAYELLTGKPVFDGKDLAAIGRQCMNYDPPRADLVIPEVSPELGELLYRCMAKHPDDRFQDARQMGRACVWAREGQSRMEPAAKGPTQSASRNSVARKGSRRNPLTLAEEVDAFLMGDRDSRRVEALKGPEEPGPSQGGRRLQNGFQRFRMLLSAGLWGLLLASVLALIGRALFPGPPPFGARDLRVLRGLAAAVATWKSGRPYVSEVLVAREESEDEVGRRIREEGAPQEDHRVYVAGLSRGERYRLRVVYPDGRNSLPLRFRLPERGERLLERYELRRTGIDSGEVDLRCRIPVEASLTFRRKGRAERLESSGWKDRHSFRITDLVENADIRDLRLTLVGIDSLERHWLGSVPGFDTWLRSFAAVVAASDFEAAREAVARGEPVSSFSVSKTFDEYRTGLQALFGEGNRGFRPQDILDIHGSLKAYEALDAIAEGRGDKAPFDVARLTEPWLMVAHGNQPETVLVRQIFSPYALAAFEAEQAREGSLMSIVAHNRAPREVTGRLLVPRDLTRPWLSFQVQNFGPKRMLRIWVDDLGPFRLRGSRSESPWAGLRLPDGVLRPGSRRIRVRAGCIGESAFAVVEAREILLSKTPPR